MKLKILSSLSIAFIFAGCSVNQPYQHQYSNSHHDTNYGGAAIGGVAGALVIVRNARVKVGAAAR